MEDREIVALFLRRSEEAIAETARKYGSYCYAIASHIVGEHGAAEECVNDAYLGAWNSIPPQEPVRLSTYLGKLTRRISINCWKKDHASKRGGSQVPLALEELAECVDHGADPQLQLEGRELGRILDRFVQSLPKTEQKVFLCRYWYLDSVQEIAGRFCFSQSKVKSMLCRTRRKLADRLQKEGISIETGRNS